MIRAAALVALALAGCERGPQTVTVPHVTGLARSQAQCAIVDAGLRWTDRGDPAAHDRAPICDDDGGIAPDPTIIRQRPPAGREVVRGTTVVIETRCTRRRPCL